MLVGIFFVLTDETDVAVVKEEEKTDGVCKDRPDTAQSSPTNVDQAAGIQL